MAAMAPFPPHKFDISFAPPGLIIKETEHPFSMVLIGEVVAVQWQGDALIFYYADGHKAYVNSKTNLTVGDYEVPGC